MQERRRARQEAAESPRSLGVVECVRQNESAIQVQGAHLRPVRMWVGLHWVHESSRVRRKGDVGEFVVKAGWIGPFGLGYSDT